MPWDIETVCKAVAVFALCKAAMSESIPNTKNANWASVYKVPRQEAPNSAGEWEFNVSNACKITYETKYMRLEHFLPIAAGTGCGRRTTSLCEDFIWKNFV